MQALFTYPQAAEYLGVSLDTIKRYIRKDILTPVELPSGIGEKPIYRLRKKDLDKLTSKCLLTKSEPEPEEEARPLVLNMEEKEAS